MPRSWATCAIGRFDSNTSRTARSRNSSGYFLGLAIAGASPSARTEPGIGASNFSRVLHSMTTIRVAVASFCQPMMPFTGPRVDVSLDAPFDEHPIIELTVADGESVGTVL